MSEPAENKAYTFQDLLSWEHSEQYELINGKAYLASPPSVRNLVIRKNLRELLENQLQETSCQVHTAPYTVRLFENEPGCPENTTTVVKPDLCIICDPDKTDSLGCKGAPDMAVEILSPDSSSLDMELKPEVYEEAGIREFWIVGPISETVRVFLLQDGRFRLGGTYQRGDRISVSILKDCVIELNDLFG